MLRKPTEGVGGSIVLASDMANFQAKLRQELEPTGLTRRQRRLCLEVRDTDIVGKDFDICTKKVVAPGAECTDQCEKFAVMDGVPGLSRSEAVRVTLEETKGTIDRRLLRQGGTGCDIRGVGMQHKGQAVIRMS